ncbi:MAG: exosortase system-associated protein, TIGR04073 family [Lentisphaeraceae bacterium]|nr:exosortase system-associated protein, TIGR04073 family [Lentisphaeraceae bacterium]
MLSRKIKVLVALFFVAMHSVALAQSEQKEVDPAAKALMYIPDRIADIFDIFNVGLAFGPSIGAEVAVTKYATFGAYTVNEAGFAWTGRNNPGLHKGKYWSTAIGSMRNELEDSDASMYFHRGDYQVRAQLALVLVHGYAGIDIKEIGDFIVGFAGFDPSDDDFSSYGEKQLDKDYDTILGTTPMHRLGRGFSNLIFGFWEIPQNMMDVTADQGPAAGATYGFVRGIGRFIVRETTGVWEIVTFPKGGEPIIEPEYPWMDHVEHNWDYNWN